MVAEQRDLEIEKEYAGESADEIPEYIPPCVYGINAFGTGEITAYSHPPEFFNDDTETRHWKLPPATVCIWPYEVMYSEDVRSGERSYDYEKRLENAKRYFNQFSPDKSLIFYYANYSNPFSEEERRRYVIVGISRLKSIGRLLYYENTSARTRERYGGGFVWQMNVTSHYPDQGLRIPYHRYRDQERVLDAILMTPENPRNFKYGTREISDDGALSLVERFAEKVAILKELGDDSEDWELRMNWLQSLIGELWQSRGLYPGMPKVLDHLGFQAAIPWWKNQVDEGREKEAFQKIFSVLEGEDVPLDNLTSDNDEVKAAQRQWALKGESETGLLQDVLPKIDLAQDQIENLLSKERERRCSVSASLEEVISNPYLLSEQYVGLDVDDSISFYQIDHAAFPSPELGGAPLGEVDDWRRLRALCVEELKAERKHAFLSSSNVIEGANRRLAHLPDWKRHEFTERYLQVDEERLKATLTLRAGSGKRYLYLRNIYEDEREIESTIRDLVRRPDINLKSPVTEKHWRAFLFEPGSRLAEKRPDDYKRAIDGQITVCQRIFRRPLSVISGAAGTGKTTVIRSIIQAVERSEGAGSTFQLLAPTGKAADRIRQATDKSASTIHSFLTSLGWLNENFTFRRSGGKKEDSKRTIIIDEASMVDLELMAALVRSINWNAVKRLILVGDPSQLPPIGRGSVFADLIDWLKEHEPNSVGELTQNIRHLENQLEDRGTGILDLASVFVRPTEEEDEVRQEYKSETVLK